MVNIEAKVSAKTVVNEKEFEFFFPNNIDIKDTTQALANIHQHLVDVVNEQNEKKKKEDEKNQDKDSDDCKSDESLCEKSDLDSKD